MAPKSTASTGRRRFDSRPLRRVALWGLAAAGALLAVVALGQSERGRDRLTLVLTELRGDAVALRAPAEDNTGKLTEALQVLAADRDRLAARIETLERNLGEVTGSIERRITAATATAATPPSPPAAPPSPPAATSPVPRPTAAPPSQPVRSEFGLDIGGAANLDGLRALWAAKKSKHGSLLEGLQPLIAIREHSSPNSVEMRLVVGPFASAAAALRLCSLIATSGARCQVAAFEGQRLASR